jgi:tetratricopeptide (TPR) repeat protein
MMLKYLVASVTLLLPHCAAVASQTRDDSRLLADVVASLEAMTGTLRILEFHLAELRAKNPSVNPKVIEDVVATQEATRKIIDLLKGKIDRLESQTRLTRREQQEIQQALAKAAEAKIELLVRIGIIEIESGRLNRAIETFNEVIRLNPGHVDAYIRRGLSRFMTFKDDAGAFADAQKAISLDPKNSRAYRLRAMCHERNGEFGKAKEDYDKAIELNPNSAESCLNRGAFHANRGDLDRAIVDFSKAARIDPESQAAFQNLGQLYLMRNEFDQAIVALKRAIDLDPKAASAYLTLGEAYSQKGEPGPAFINIDIGMSLGPTDPRAHQIRGAALLRAGKTEEAIPEFDHVLSHAAQLPVLVSAYKCRGFAYQRLNLPDRARADFEKAEQLHRQLRGQNASR